MFLWAPRLLLCSFFWLWTNRKKTREAKITIFHFSSDLSPFSGGVSCFANSEFSTITVIFRTEISIIKKSLCKNSQALHNLFTSSPKNKHDIILNWEFKAALHIFINCHVTSTYFSHFPWKSRLYQCYVHSCGNELWRQSIELIRFCFVFASQLFGAREWHENQLSDKGNY